MYATGKSKDKLEPEDNHTTKRNPVLTCLVAGHRNAGNFFCEIHDMYALELVLKQKVVEGLAGAPGVPPVGFERLTA